MASKCELIIFNGRRYYRKPGKRYFEARVRCEDDSGRKFRYEMLHRAIWEFHHGPIPDGYDVHHKDNNRDNNDVSNFELLTRSEHSRLHDALADWNSRPEAEEQRKRNRGKTWNNAQYRKYTCLACGKEFESRIINQSAKFCSVLCGSRYRDGTTESKNCQICGTDFMGRPGAYTCSDACSERYWNTKCENCGKEFQRNQNTQTFCSKGCQTKDRWKKWRATRVRSGD